MPVAVIVDATDYFCCTVTADTWRLNGMSVSVKTDLSDVHVQQEKSVVSATYTSTLDTASFELTFRKQ